MGLEVARLKTRRRGKPAPRTASRWKWRLLEKQEIRDLITLSKAQGGNNMSVKEQISKLKDLSGSSAAKQRILSLCDEGSFFGNRRVFYKSRDGLCEAVCGFATVGGEGIYVFAQSPDVSDGAMSLAQAKK